MKITLKSIYIFIFFLLPALTHAAANTYYVTQNGNGAKDGKSLASAWSASQFNSLKGTGYAGDTFYFSGTFTSWIGINISSTTTNDITIDNVDIYATGRQKIQISGGANIEIKNSRLYSQTVSFDTYSPRPFDDGRQDGSLPDSNAVSQNIYKVYKYALAPNNTSSEHEDGIKIYGNPANVDIQSQVGKRIKYSIVRIKFNCLNSCV